MNLLNYFVCSIRPTTRFLALLFAFAAFPSHAQFSRSDESISNEIYVVVLNTTWHKEVSSKAFVIGVLDADSSLYQLLSRKYRGLRLRKKPVRIVHFTSIDQITPTSVMVVDNRFNRNIREIYQAIPQQGCLLLTITSGRKDYNMVDFNGRLKKHDFKVNQINLSKAGLELAETFQNPEGVITREEVEVPVPVTQTQTEYRYLSQGGGNLKPASYYKNLSLQEKLALLEKQTDLLLLQEIKIREQDSIMQAQRGKMTKLSAGLARQEKKLTEQKRLLGEQEFVIILFIAMLGFIGLAAVMVINIYRNNRTLLDEVSSQKEIIQAQNQKMESVLAEVTDSIHYAHRIQQAVLPGATWLQQHLDKSHFIIFKPKDIVSGDFYFVERKKNQIVVAVGDCTGHGVPGAFVAMLCQGLLQQIVQHFDQLRPAEILNELRLRVIQALQQKGTAGEQMDGLDISLLVFEQGNSSCEWAGANIPLYVVRDGVLKEYKPDRQPIAIYPRMRTFSSKKVELKPGDRLFLFSDGYQDQFGGDQGKKFLSKTFRRIIADTSKLKLGDQASQLEFLLNSWMHPAGGSFDQVDDITILAIEV